jgi:hypothetical protein
MDIRTKIDALKSLAAAAAELAADVAKLTQEAAGHASRAEAEANPYVAGNVIVGTLLPAEQHVEELQAIFRAMNAVHSARETRS